MKLTKQKLQQIIKEELLVESPNYMGDEDASHMGDEDASPEAMANISPDAAEVIRETNVRMDEALRALGVVNDLLQEFLNPDLVPDRNPILVKDVEKKFDEARTALDNIGRSLVIYQGTDQGTEH